MSVLVFTENWEGKFKKLTYELVSYAAELAKMNSIECNAVSVGNTQEVELNSLGKYGVKKVFHINNEKYADFNSQAYSNEIGRASCRERV